MLEAVKANNSRTLTSAWIETPRDENRVGYGPVALSRVRGLKLVWNDVYGWKVLSHSHECVD